MIQHVENLRRVYAKEHAELLELRETIIQNERSFGSQTERGRVALLKQYISCCCIQMEYTAFVLFLCIYCMLNILYVCILK